MKTVVFQAFAALLLAIVLPLHAEKVRVGFYLEDGFCGFDAKGERTGVCVDWAAAVAPINLNSSVEPFLRVAFAA